MSNVTTIYDQVRTKLSTLFPNKVELVNPDDLNDNPDSSLSDGYGIIIGPAIPQDFEYTQYLELRSFIIVFTEEVKRVEGDKEPLITIKKNILEDMVTLKKDFLSPNQLGIEASLEIVELGNTTAIDIIPGKEKILTSSTTLNIGISETINV